MTYINGLIQLTKSNNNGVGGKQETKFQILVRLKYSFPN